MPLDRIALDSLAPGTDCKQGAFCRPQPFCIEAAMARPWMASGARRLWRLLSEVSLRVARRAGMHNYPHALAPGHIAQHNLLSIQKLRKHRFRDLILCFAHDGKHRRVIDVRACPFRFAEAISSGRARVGHLLPNIAAAGIRRHGTLNHGRMRRC